MTNGGPLLKPDSRLDASNKRFCRRREVLLLSHDESVVPFAEEVIQREDVQALAILSGEGVIVQDRNADAESNIFLNGLIVVEDQDDIEIQVLFQESIFDKRGQSA